MATCFTFFTQNSPLFLPKKSSYLTHLLKYEFKFYNRTQVYNSTSIDSSQHILKYRSLHNFKSDIEWNYRNIVTIGLSTKYFSKIENLDGVIEEFEKSTHIVSTIQDIRFMDYYRNNNKGNWVFDLRASYSYKNHKISIIANNLMNYSYSLRPLKMEAPRSILLQYGIEL